MNLYSARSLAEKIKEQLAPFCEPARCEIVGSIRRAREWVNDIDLAVIPKPGERLKLLARAKLSTTVVKEGEDIVILRLANGTQLDLYFARGPKSDDLFAPVPSNWGSIVLSRTGSKEHNIYICKRASELGLKWETMRGLVVVEERVGRKAGTVLPCETEDQIFAALNLEPIPPALREK